MKHSSRRRKEIEHGTIDSLGADSEAFRFGYFYRSIEDHVNAYAAQAGHEDSFSDIAARVSQLLEAASVRERMVISELVPEVRQNGAANRRGRPPRHRPDEFGATQSVHVRARDHEPLKRSKMSAAGRAAISRAQRARWAKVHAERNASKPKRKFTAKQLRAVRENAVLARIAYKKKFGKKEFKMSDVSRQKISAARKLYWKERKAREAAAERDE